MRIDAARALGAYAAATTLALAWLALASAAPISSVIDAERINIREPDGTLRLVITDAAHQPGIVLGKRVVPHPHRTDAGLLFYNREGIENGGLIFDGGKVGDRVTSGGSLTFDRYLQDQTVQVMADEDGPARTSGVRVNDRPDAPIDFEAAVAAARMPAGAARAAAIRAANATQTPRGFFGRATDGSATLQLRDGAGRVRLRLGVAADGAARIDFLDEGGRVTRSVNP